MEDELRCPHCKQFCQTPVLLACSHSYCLQCAIDVQVPVVAGNDGASSSSTGHSAKSCGAASSSGGGDTESDDKLSVLSESDSGVVCSSANSRPNSFIAVSGSGRCSVLSQPASVGILTPPTALAGGFSLKCAACSRVHYFADCDAPKYLPRNRALANVIERYSRRCRDGNSARSPRDRSDNLSSSRHSLCASSSSTSSLNLPTSPTSTAPAPCQLCESPLEPNTAKFHCLQCDVYYCDQCRETCHPKRGPLAQHQMVQIHGHGTLQRNGESSSTKCMEHPSQPLSLFCSTCQYPVCDCCQQPGARHFGHDTTSLEKLGKQQKAELSGTLSVLSEKARSATENISRTKAVVDAMPAACSDFEQQIESQIDGLITALHDRKEVLLQFAREERDRKTRQLREQVGNSTSRLSHTTGLIQFCIEVLKEPDPAAFLQVSRMLINRAANAELGFQRDMSQWMNQTGTASASQAQGQSQPQSQNSKSHSHKSAHKSAAAMFDYCLDVDSVLECIQQLDFAQLKAPGAPTIIAEECSAENNSVTVSWRPPGGAHVLGYSLQLDATNTGAQFKEVYNGRSTVCTVDGLHFNTLYHARVHAYNRAGRGPESEPIGLHTAEVAWFPFDTENAHKDLVFSNEGHSVSTSCFEHRVALGAVGFSRGVHYWEITIDRHECNADVVVGIARKAVDRSIMLGKDSHGWAIYIDGKRSWLLHNNTHQDRRNSGIVPSCTREATHIAVLGVKLDCDNGTLTFSVNDHRRGAMENKAAFTDLPRGVYYPAVAVNRHAQVTVHSGLAAPSRSSSEGTNSDDNCAEAVKNC